MREGIIAFADRHLEPYIIREDELIPDFCPICHGGNNRDRYTFALNLYWWTIGFVRSKTIARAL